MEDSLHWQSKLEGAVCSQMGYIFEGNGGSITLLLATCIQSIESRIHKCVSSSACVLINKCKYLMIE